MTTADDRSQDELEREILALEIKALKLPNDDISRELGDLLETAAVTVKAVERISGLNFFPDGPPEWLSLKGEFDLAYWFPQ